MTRETISAAGPHNPGRRNFLSAVGATVASLQTAACIRKPYEKILPYAERPEDLVPGEARHYATAWNVGGAVQGLLVRSTDGRPTKVDGNPNHPMTGGSTIWAQASVLSLYDPERSKEPVREGECVSPDEAVGFLKKLPDEIGDGSGLAVVVPELPSPTADRLWEDIRAKYPKAELYRFDGAGTDHARAGAALVGIEGAAWTTDGTPTVIAAFDADPIGTEGDTTAFTKAFAAGRDPNRKPAEANRLYVVEPHVSITGSNADHRMAVKGSEVGDFLAALAHHLKKGGLNIPTLDAPKDKLDSKFVKALAKDLLSRKRGSTIVMVGERQPAHVHALGFVLNEALGNFGKTLRFTKQGPTEVGALSDLVRRMNDGSVKQLVVMGSNPVYEAPADLDFGELFQKVPLTIHLGLYRDETGRLATWHIPQSHYLESWGDLRAREGTTAIQQPLVAPLYPSLSPIEFMARLTGAESKGYDLVRATHQGAISGSFDKRWQRWLHDGVVDVGQAPSFVPSVKTDGLAAAYKFRAERAQGMELAFVRDNAVLDGRFGNSPWLQELPDPITKIAWDNAAVVSPNTAEKIGVPNNLEQSSVRDTVMVDVSVGGETVRLPVWVQPGTAEDVVVLSLGYGRKHGGKFAKSGFDVNSLRTAESPYIRSGAKVTPTRKGYAVACMQPEASMHDRPIVRDATRGDFTDEPNFVEKFEVMDEDHVASLLWDEPEYTAEHQWALTIDLNSCVGCGSCTVACQAENNIPWVGKEDALKGREMHWIRIDRYFEPKQSDQVEVRYQPMACVQCETAPCENVCPVGATVHGPEGLNNMAYNRCIGTRYCSNNCPYKVRRFNFFHYTVRNDADYGMGIAMQRNPDVTVRYRGVMEKCTYCVQRINKARIHAKVNGDGIIPDGTVKTACQEACPADCITFGNIRDPDSNVSHTREDPRNYAVLSELNLRPRTTYLAKLTNPNPDLAEG